MVVRVSHSRRVRRWLVTQTAYLEQYGADAVERMRERLPTADLILAEHPRIGRPTDVPGIRRLVVAPYVLTYRIAGFEIVIVDIRHERQAERPFLDEGSS